MAEKRYTAFISYRHVEPDRSIAIRLHSLIEHYHIPKTVQSVTGKKSLGRVFRDEEELPLAMNLSDNIEYALAESEWLIVICSPALLDSRWCMKEIDTFIRQGKKDHILLVLASGTPETSFPPQMRTAAVNGIEVAIEPLAANVAAPTVRESLKKLEIEKLRAIARILGVNFDDLRRRAKRRKLRIAAAVTAGALALTAFSGALIYRARQERVKAAEQAVRAEMERQNAKMQEAYAAQKANEARSEQIAKNIEKAIAMLNEGERLEAVELGLETLKLSDNAGSERRDEILELIRRACYGQSFSVLASMDNKNLALHYITVSPDGRYLLGIANTNTVTLLDIFSGETIFNYAPTSKQVLDPFFSPDGSRFIATCDNGSCAYVWNTGDCSLAGEIHSDSGEPDEILTADFIGDSDHVLVHDHDKIYIYDLTDDSRKLIHTLGSIETGFDPEKGLFYILFGTQPDVTVYVDYGAPVVASPDGSKILVGGMDGSDGVIIIDREGQYLCTLEFLPGMMGDDFVFSPDASLVSCSAFMQYFGIWDANTGELLWIYYAEDEVSAFTFSPDSKNACYTFDGTLYAVEARTNSILFQGGIDGHEEIGLYVTPGVEYSPDGEYICLRNYFLFIIDAASGLPLAGFTDERYAFAYSAFSANGKYLVLAEQNGTVSLLSTKDNSTIHNDVGSKITYVTPPACGERGSTAVLHGTHELTGAFKASTPETEQYTDMCISPDGRYAALIYADGAIELFEPAESAEPKYFLSEFSSRACAVAFGGDFFAAADREGRILLFDLSAGETIAVYNEEACASSFCFSEDGTILLAADFRGNIVSAYPTDGGKKLFTMRNDFAKITGMGFTEDGKCAVATYDGGAIIADLLRSEDELLAFASNLAGDNSD